MKRKTLMMAAVLIVLLVSLFGTAAAQTGTDGSGATPGATTPVAPTPAAPTGTTTGTKFFTHPVVDLLSKYFGRETETSDPATAETPAPVSGTPEAAVTPVDWTTTPEPTGETPTTGAPTTDELGQQIAAFHEDGMGFGVLVKLYAMAEASKKACPPTTTTGDTGTTTGTTSGGTTADTGTTTGATDTCTPVTVDELVAQFKAGAGMGQLFKEYGKPNLLGVGHVKKEMKKQQQAQPESSATVTAGDGQTDDTTMDTQEHGNGNGNGNGKSDKSDKQNNGNPNKGNNGNGNGNGKGNGNGGGNGKGHK